MFCISFISECAIGLSDENDVMLYVFVKLTMYCIRRSSVSLWHCYHVGYRKIYHE